MVVVVCKPISVISLKPKSRLINIPLHFAAQHVLQSEVLSGDNINRQMLVVWPNMVVTPFEFTAHFLMTEND